MYLRFVTSVRDAYSHQRLGIFQPAYDLTDSGDLDPDEMRPLRSALVWFERNLPVPDCSKFDVRAIFWFKAGAREAMKRVWDVANALKRHGLSVEVIKTTRPGYVFYEDDLQIAAVPFRDTMRA